MAYLDLNLTVSTCSTALTFTIHRVSQLSLKTVRVNEKMDERYGQEEHSQQDRDEEDTSERGEGVPGFEA